MALELTDTSKDTSKISASPTGGPTWESPTKEEPLVGETAEITFTESKYGWVCVVAVLLVNAHTWGILTAYSVFLSHYVQSNTLDGATTLNYALIGGLQFSQPFLVSPLATKLMGHAGVRTCAITGAVIHFASLIGASFATAIWHLYLSQGLGVGWGVGFMLVATQNIVPQWFDKRLGLANGIAASGTGLGGLVYSFVSGYMIERLGVGWALRILAIVSGTVNLLSGALLKSRQQQIHAGFSVLDRGLFLRRDFVLLCAFTAFSLLAEMIILTQLPTYGSTTLSLDATQASVIGAMVALGQIVGRIAIGSLSDRLGRINLAILVTALAGVCSLAVWIVASSYAILIFFSICAGAFAGAFWSIIAPVTVDVVGLHQFPTALSAMFVIACPFTMASPVIAMAMVEAASGSYLSCQVFAGIMFLAAAVSLWTLRTLKLLEHDNGSGSGAGTLTRRGKMTLSNLLDRIFHLKRM